MNATATAAPAQPEHDRTRVALKLHLMLIALPLLLAGANGISLWFVLQGERMSRGDMVMAALAGTAVLSIPALLAAAIGGFGLARIRAMGRAAMTSREALLRAFTSGRKLLPWLIVGNGFFVLVASAICLTLWTLLLGEYGAHDRNNMKLVIAGGLGVLALIFMAFKLIWTTYRSSRQLFEPEPLEAIGARIHENDAPALWAFVREVAGKARMAMPDHIVAGFDECFFVTESAVRLRDRETLPPGRTLYLPMPYMAFMGRDEAAAVIGHELAHFSGADTQYSQHFAPIYASAVKNLHMLHEADEGWLDLLIRPTRWLVEFFLDTFHLATRHWSRERELAADRAGASVAGARAIGLSLLRIGVLRPRVDEALERQSGKNARGGILGQVIALVRQQGLDDPRQHLDDMQPHPTDTHPTTRKRLAALGIEENAALFAEAVNPQCSTLLVELGLAQPGDLDMASSTVAAS
jgi:hypothetical protein